MKSLVQFIVRNSKLIATGYIVASMFTIVILIIRINKHECQKTQIEIDAKFKQKIQEIDDAKTRHDIDSLLFDLYGFKSVE